MCAVREVTVFRDRNHNVRETSEMPTREAICNKLAMNKLIRS